MTTDGQDDEKRKPSEGSRLRAILDRDFRLVRSTDGRTFGVRHTAPGRALEHGKASSLLIQQVSKDFLATYGKWPAANGISEVSSYAFAMAGDQPAEAVPIRCHWQRDTQTLFLDVCDTAGAVLKVDRNGAREAKSPVTFRRSRSSAPIPWPLPVGEGGPADLDSIWTVVPAHPSDRPLVLGLLLVAWMTGTAQPIVLLVGPQDAGKTSTGRFLLSLVDPSTGERGGTMPRDEREWKARVSNSRVVLIDNLSTITPEASDLLCKVSTGGEATTRSLYTDDDAHISNLKIPVWLTSIDPGVLRNDLASRISPIELVAIAVDDRIAESELAAKQDEIRSTATRGLFWLMSEVLKLWPDMDKARLEHRMGDYAIIVRCIDQILGTEGVKRLAEHARDLAEDVVDGDPLAQVVVKLVEKAEQTGIGLPQDMTAENLLDRCSNLRQDATGLGWHAGDKSWPRTPKVFSARLTRIEPALLKAHRIRIDRRRSNGQKLLSVYRETGSQAPDACDPLRPLRPSCDPVLPTEIPASTCADDLDRVARVARVARMGVSLVTSSREERAGQDTGERVPLGATLATLPGLTVTDSAETTDQHPSLWSSLWDGFDQEEPDEAA